MKAECKVYPDALSCFLNLLLATFAIFTSPPPPPSLQISPVATLTTLKYFQREFNNVLKDFNGDVC